MARVLVQLSDVKTHIGETTADYDAVLTKLIEWASDKILDVAGREFVVDGENPQTRVFDVSADVVLDREFEVGDLAVPPTAVEIFAWDGSLRETVDLATVDRLPRRRESWQPIAALRFKSGLPTSVYLVRGETIKVTGTWGFPEVPGSIVWETLRTVAAWFIRDVKALGKLFKENSPQFQSTAGQHQLPLSAQQAAKRWRVPFAGVD